MKRSFIIAFAALALVLLAAVSVSAQAPVAAAVTQVDTSHFPQIDVYVSVADAAGNPVRNVQPSAFRLAENGQPMQLISATRSGEQGPVNTVLLIDRTGSMSFANKMDGAKQAAAVFVDRMRPGDRTALVQFDTQVDTLQTLTDDKAALLASIQKIYPRGNTALYDAIDAGGKYFENVSGRKAMIVVTDGMDNSSRLNLGSLLQQVQTAGYSVYTIGLGAQGAGYGNQEGIDESTLRQIADSSYGTYAYAPDASQLDGLYQQLSYKIQNEYRLSYITPNPLHNGVNRGITVTAPGAASLSAAYNPGGVIPEVAPRWTAWLLFLAALAVLLGLFFAPLGLRFARERGAPTPQLAPQPARASMVRLTGPAQASGAGSTPARPSRIKIRNAPAAPGAAQSQMPWDEGAPRH